VITKLFKKPLQKSSAYGNNTEIIERLERLQKELKSTQNAIPDIRRDIPFYLCKALRDYGRGFSG